MNTLTIIINNTLLRLQWFAQQADTAYGEDVYGAGDSYYGGAGFLDTPITGVPDVLPNTGRELISFVGALGLFAVAYLLIKKNYDRTHNNS